MANKVKIAFDLEPMRVALERLLPTKTLPKTVDRQKKYQQVLSSVREVGVIEPVMIYPMAKGKGSSGEPESYMILDGHLRVRALKDLGQESAPCLLSTDDESYTYNKILNRLSSIQEHFMILKALEGGGSEERLAQVLNVDIAQIRAKRDLLNGLCAEAVGLLKTKAITASALRYFKQVKPMRQIEMAELMVAAGNVTEPYAHALFLATASDQLLHPEKEKAAEEVSSADIARMEREMASVELDIKQIWETYGDNELVLTVSRNYLAKLLANARIVRFLSQHHGEILAEFEKIVAAERMEGVA